MRPLSDESSDPGLPTGGFVQSAAEESEEGFAGGFEFTFEASGAVAIAASPRFGAVVVAALAPVVRVLHLHQIEIFFPVGSLLLQRRRTVADFYPARGLIGTGAGFAHVAEVLFAGDGPAAERAIFDGREERLFTSGLEAGAD
jgi:hypothetical protein